MSMVCTRCNTTHDQAMHCPTCGTALTYHVPRKKQGIDYADLAKNWQHTDWGRFFIGVGLAQGLFYGLNLLLKSILLAVGAEPINSETAPLTELFCIQGFQLCGLVAGSMTAGVGRRQAVLLGVYLGMTNSILSLLLRQWPAHALNTYWVYAQPFLQILVGSLGALVSSLTWKPLVATALPESPSQMAKKLGAKRPRVLKIFIGPIGWFRVVLGALAAVAGCLAARHILEMILSASEQVSMDEYMQESLVLWGLKGSAFLLGGLLAGAGTTNGLKQGLVVGILSGAAMNVVLGFHRSPLEIVALSMGLALVLALVGGWFGGQLFPPVTVRRRLKDMGPAAI